MAPRMNLNNLAFVLICEICVVVNIFLFNFYRRARSLPIAESIGKWEYSPLSQGGFSYRQLALVSAFGLFLELLMIRWISSEIRMFAYFKNFVLIACFLGFGSDAICAVAAAICSCLFYRYSQSSFW